MRMPGQVLHKVPLFGWAIFVTAVLLLLSLPVLAGIIYILPALYLAICWKLLLRLKILIRQSAGNQTHLSVFEIFRDYTPELMCYKNIFNSRFYFSSLNCLNNKNGINNSKNENFSHYLTGLIEGDGSIFVPKTARSLKGRLNYPSIQIIFDLRDFPLSLITQQRLGHGSISRKKGVNAYILTINNKDGILLIISLINGKMKTPKIHSLNKLIDWVNKKEWLNIEKKMISIGKINSSAWLSGFIDANGHFSVRTSIIRKYPKIECRFELIQRQIDHNNYDNYGFLKEIADLLLTDVKSIRLTKPHPEYRIRTTNLKANHLLTKYLNQYPLFSSKYLNYMDWLKILKYFENKEHTELESINKIIKIKSGMNDRRTDFNWDHLNKFYNLYK
jgi:hypothetical protein